ncbi:hypothetical protein PFDG_04366 [Plasmodium falciparum Dd2]|uniref:Uncharacterized protein n=1 Tax=Plasmodium falciparum (isolate Dd2) TaxID=57267 RepID=A0A0L7M553_PLAF4|nr:hypothetical protein PFDG_04366 [Plasmodium falciparum Dd2]
MANTNVNVQMIDNENINNMNNSYLDDFYLFKNNTSNHEYSNKQMGIENNNNNNIHNGYAHGHKLIQII